MLTATRVPDSVQVETPFTIELRVFNNTSEPRHLTLVLDLDLNGPILDCAGSAPCQSSRALRAGGADLCEHTRISTAAACCHGAGIGASSTGLFLVCVVCELRYSATGAGWVAD